MKNEHLSYSRLAGHYPPLFRSYCTDDGLAGKFFAHRYRDEKDLIERAARAAEKGIEPCVVERLREYHQRMGAPAQSLAALDRLAQGAAVVIAGQQPSAGWGPLYNFHKAQTAMKFAQGIEARGIPCVPVFWNHSDDVRKDESVFFPDRENRVHEVAMPAGEQGVPLYEADAPETLRMFGTALADALPKTDFSAWTADLLQACHRGSVAESFTRALLSILGPYGLVVLEPRHLEGERCLKFYVDHLKHPDRMSKGVEAGRQAVIAEGLPDQLGREVGIDLYEIRNGRRTRVEATGTAKGRLSAGVALRPLLQDTVLPTCAAIAGPSEVGYQAELLPAYRALGLDPPVVIPRVTATILEPKIARVMEKHGLSAADLFGEEGALAARMGGGEPDIPGEIGRLAGRIMDSVDGALGVLSGNVTIAKARQKTLEKIEESLSALAGRTREELERREDSGRGQLSKLMAHVRPGGKLQERVFTPFYYTSLFGPGFPERLLGALDPFVFTHQLISIL